MGEVVYTSNVRIEKREGATRDAWVPGHDGPVRFGIHGGIAEHYGREVEEEHTATLDYVVAAAAGWLTGTLGGALEAREIQSAPDRLTAEAEGEIEVEDGVLILKRIRVRYTLRVSIEKRETARRVHEMHAQKCPVYRSIGGCVDITTELMLESLGDWMKLGRPRPKASVREPLGGFTVKRVFVYLALVLVGGGAVVRLGRVRLRESNGEASRGTKPVRQ